MAERYVGMSKLKAVFWLNNVNDQYTEGGAPNLSGTTERKAKSPQTNKGYFPSSTYGSIVSFPSPITFASESQANVRASKLYISSAIINDSATWSVEPVSSMRMERIYGIPVANTNATKYEAPVAAMSSVLNENANAYVSASFNAYGFSANQGEDISLTIVRSDDYDGPNPSGLKLSKSQITSILDKAWNVGDLTPSLSRQFSEGTKFKVDDQASTYYHTVNGSEYTYGILGGNLTVKQKLEKEVVIYAFYNDVTNTFSFELTTDDVSTESGLALSLANRDKAKYDKKMMAAFALANEGVLTAGDIPPSVRPESTKSAELGTAKAAFDSWWESTLSAREALISSVLTQTANEHTSLYPGKTETEKRTSIAADAEKGTASWWDSVQTGLATGASKLWNYASGLKPLEVVTAVGAAKVVNGVSPMVLGLGAAAVAFLVLK